MHEGDFIFLFLPPLLIVLATFLYLRWQRFDDKTILLALAAFCLCYFQFYHSTPQQFSIDAPAHIEYVVYLAHHIHVPGPWDGVMNWRHPPTYYAIAGAFYRLAEYAHADDPLAFARQFSMICYVAYLLFSTQLLRLIAPADASYYAALVLLLFWPIGVTMGGRITCDPLLFVGEAGTLYGLARWLKDQEVGSLSAAFFCAALSIAAKNGGVTMFVLSGAVLAFALWEQRRSLRRFLRPDLFLSIATAFLAYKLTLLHGKVHTAETCFYSWNLWWPRVSGFSPFLLLYDTDLGLSHGLFWNMFLHTLLLGDDSMPWKSVSLLIAFQVLWVVLLLFLLAGLLRIRALQLWERHVFLLTIGFLLAMLGAMLFMLYCTDNYGYGDARYAYPCVTALVLWYAKTLTLWREAGSVRTYRAGIGLAWLFATLTVVLYFYQYFGPAF